VSALQDVEHLNLIQQQVAALAPKVPALKAKIIQKRYN